MKKSLFILLGLLALNSNAASPDMVKGIDLTALTSVTAAQLNQLVDNAYPATGKGMVILSATEPDESTYPRFTNYVWIDISVIPYTLKTFTTGSWVAATVGASAVGTSQLADNAVTTAKILDGTIATADIGTNQITSATIADGAITSGKYAGLSITNGILAADAVTTDKILDGTIATADINAAQITAALMASDSVVTASLTNGAITSAKIANATIVSNNIASGGITVTNIAAGTSANQYIRANDSGTMTYMSGGIGAYAYTNRGDAVTNTTAFSYDNTTITTADGNQIFTLNITPKSTNSVLEIDVQVLAGASINDGPCLALFNSTSANALAVASENIFDATAMVSLRIHYIYAVTSTAQQTFTVNLGTSSGNAYLNGINTGPMFNGGGNSSMTVKEIFQ